MGEFFRAESDAVVRNLEDQFVVGLLEVETDLAIFGRELEGVDQEVGDDFFQPVVIDGLDRITGKVGGD